MQAASDFVRHIKHTESPPNSQTNSTPDPFQHTRHLSASTMARTKRKVRPGQQVEDNVQKQMEKKPRRLAPVRSHYNKLTPQEKSTIRPFVFLNLPAELRLTIYGYLLKSLKPLDKHPRADCDLVEMTDDGHFLGDPYMSLLSRNILSTCHQIYLEGQQFFHENHSFGFHVYLRSPDFVTGALAAPAALPIPIKPQMLKSLHLLIAMDQPSNSFLTADWSILKSMTSLRRLDVALRMTHKCQYLSWHNCQMHTPDSEQMKQSLLIRGMVVEILMLVSATVDLNWTEWNERDNLPRGYRTATQLVESSTLQVLADQFAPLRGLESGSSTPRSKSTV